MNQPGAQSGLLDWLGWLETLSPFEINLGLERVTQVLDRLQLAKPGRVIHVAGTNGKGSSVAMLEALFLRSDERVGAYTSPHLDRYNERIRVNGVAAGDTEIVTAFERVESVRDDLPLTYFEFGTLAAAVVFEARDTDTVILEVGMGGRLDAVNAIEADAAIISNVSLDHCDWLGDDIESIAREKAGVMRPQKPLVFGSRDMPNAILATARELGSDLRCLGEDFDYALETGSTNTWAWSGRRCKLSSLAMPALAGRFQVQNAATVLALIEAMQLDRLLDPELINAAFAKLELAGRCQQIHTDRNWLLDVAHNPAAARVLGNHLANQPVTGETLAIIGVLADKDQSGIISPLNAQVTSWIAVTPEAARAVPGRELAAGIANQCNRPCLIANSLTDAMQFAHDRSSADDRILVTGSFYVVGPALKWLASAA